MRDRHDETTAMPSAVRALARIMTGDPGRDAVLLRACEATQSVIGGAHDVSVTLVDGDAARTAAVTGELAQRADALQYAAGDGPCLEATRSGMHVLVPDVTNETRWPDYVAGAIDAGVRASLSVPFPAEVEVVGALNIYATRPDAFDDGDVSVGYDLANYAGIVAMATDEWQRAATLAQQLQDAMATRAVIEQAKGILMAQRRCTAEDAFDALVRLSQESHRKLRDVAQAIVAQISTG